MPLSVKEYFVLLLLILNLSPRSNSLMIWAQENDIVRHFGAFSALCINVGCFNDYDFTHRQLDQGFELTVTSQIQIHLLQRNDILLYQGSSNYLIPSEQHISRATDRLQDVDTTVYMEFLFQHLSRQTSIIYSDTFNNYPETQGYIVKVPTLYDLNQTPLNN